MTNPKGPSRKPRKRIGYTVAKMRSGRYQVVITDPVSGKRRGLGAYADRDQAERAGLKASEDARRGLWIDPGRADIPLLEYLAGWLARKRASGDHNERYSIVAGDLVRLYAAPYLGGALLSELSAGLVHRWLDDLKADRVRARGVVGLMPAKTYRLLHAALEDAVRAELLPRNPFVSKSAGVEKSVERPLLTPEQVIAIANEVEPRWQAMILVAGWCGLRFGELAALRRRHVNELHKTIVVEVAVSDVRGKGRVEKAPKTAAGRRTVAVPTRIMEALVVHLHLWGESGPDGLVFVGPRGGPLRLGSWSGAAFRPALARLGMVGVHFHDLRHAAATMAAQAGGTEREVQARIGHATADAARRYQHAAQSRDAELADRMGATIPSLERAQRMQVTDIGRGHPI